MNETWRTLRDLAQKLGHSVSAVRRRVKQEHCKGRDGKRSANGKLQREYLVSSLPDEWQTKIMLGSIAPAGEMNGETRPLFPANEKQRAKSKEWIKSAVRLENSPKRQRNKVAAQIAAETGLSIRTIYYHRSRLKSGKLLPNIRNDRGKSRTFEKHPKAAAFVQFKYLNEGIQNARLIHEILRREWPQLEGRGNPPSERTVRAYLATIPLPVRTLAHEGKEALLSKCSPFILRQAPPAMDWWIADHRLFDVLVRNTMFAEIAPDAAYRMWITAIYDWGSRALVGYCFAPNPCSDTINSALRMALSRYGFPKHFYWDNGKDFKSVKARLDEITMSDGLRRMLLQHDISFGVPAALPKRPRSKPIEAYFTRWSKRFDMLWRGAYVGNRPGNCPEITREAQKEHQQFLAGKREDTPFPSDREFVIAATQWAVEYNETAPLDCLDGKTPDDVLEEQSPAELRKPVPRRALDALMLKDDQRTVLQGGCVEIQRMRYEPRPESIGTLYLHQGRKVQILRDPYDLSVAVALDSETYEFVGELMLQIPVGQSPDNPQTQAQVKARMRTERALARGCNNYLEALAAGASASGWRTEREGLLERAQLRTGTDDLPAAAPGARRPQQLLSPPPKLAPAFVCDAEPLTDAELASFFEVED